MLSTKWKNGNKYFFFFCAIIGKYVFALLKTLFREYVPDDYCSVLGRYNETNDLDDVKRTKFITSAGHNQAIFSKIWNEDVKEVSSNIHKVKKTALKILPLSRTPTIAPLAETAIKLKLFPSEAWLQ